MPTAIIGAGIAGLTAAYELVKRGERPILIEPGRVGGMVCSQHQDGFTLECGPNVLVERPHVIALINELGLTSEIRYPSVMPYGQYVWFDGKPQKVPAGLFEFLTSPLFSWRTKLALPVRLAKAGVLQPQAEDESVLTFFSRLIGEDSTWALLDPVLKGIYGGDVDRLSARALFPNLWSAADAGDSVLSYMRRKGKGGKPRIMVISGGIQRLPDALFAAIKDKIELRATTAERITPVAQGFSIQLGDGSSCAVDRCVVTVAGKNLASLLEPIAPPVSAAVREVSYAGLTIVHLAVDRSERLIPAAFGALFPRGMPDNFLGVMFNSLIFPHVAPPEKHVITAVLGGAQAEETMCDPVELRERFPAFIKQLLNLRDVDILHTYQWPRAIPQLEVGHFKVVEALDSVERAWPGLGFVGVDRGGVGVSDRVRLAREGVERVWLERGPSGPLFHDTIRDKAV